MLSNWCNYVFIINKILYFKYVITKVKVDF